MGGYARAHRCLGGSCCQFGSKSTEPRRSVSIAIHHAKGELCFAANVLWQEPGRRRRSSESVPVTCERGTHVLVTLLD